MNGKETSKDIIAEMRDLAEHRDWHNHTSRSNRERVSDLADRLDAAHKREVDALKQRLAELDAEVAAKDEVIKRLNDAISEEQRRKMATAENSSAVGNAAKLRKALEELMKFTCNSCERRPCEDDAEEEDGQIVPSFCSAIIGARNVLADPPRNCDRFSTWEEANKAFEKANAHRIGFMNLYTDVLKWLFAPAKEGGANA